MGYLNVNPVFLTGRQQFFHFYESILLSYCVAIKIMNLI